jgi:LmbE family N-acetylglucosaminyl deacetylase
MKIFIPLLMVFFISSCGTGTNDEPSQTSGMQTQVDSSSDNSCKRALIVISPHPDDESIMAAATIYRTVHDGITTIEAVYLSSGDGAGLPGKCCESSETEKKRKIVELREAETAQAWEIIGLDVSKLHFLRYPDTSLVEDTILENGKRVDTLNADGMNAVNEITGLVPELIPADACYLTIITGSEWDAHPDHRTAYTAARSAALRVIAGRKIPVTLLSAIVHDELVIDSSYCCLGDLHWPNKGPRLDYETLSNSQIRPRPPKWDVIMDVSDLTSIRTDALNAHVSQVSGYPKLCMVLVYKEYFRRWMEKTQEVFYKEDFPVEN